jgi:hypothetical protein
MASIMKFRTLLLAGVVVCIAQFACAQDNISAAEQAAVRVTSQPPNPLLVLHADNKTIVLDPEVHDMPAFESRVDARWVQSIEMLSGDEAYSRYGNRGRNGVIIIEFKPNYIFPLDFPEPVKDGA